METNNSLTAICCLFVAALERRAVLSLHADDLLQGGNNLYEIFLLLHDLFDGLIRAGNFVENATVFAAFHPFRLRDQIVEAVGFLGFRPGHQTPRAVGATAKAVSVALAFDDIGLRSHGAGNDAVVFFLRTHGSLAGDVNAFAKVNLFFGVVVVAVHLQQRFERLAPADVFFDDPLEPRHHDLTVRASVVLRPLQIAPVGIKFGGAGDEVGEVGIGETLSRHAGQFFSGADVGLGQHVADVPRAGVQHEPDALFFVEANFDEVVAAAEGAELFAGFFLEALHAEVQVAELTPSLPVGGFFFDFLVFVEADGDVGFDIRTDFLELAFQAIARIGGLDGTHAAADVHAHGSRHDRFLGGDDGTDEGPFAQVNVGHQGDMFEDEGKGSNVLCHLRFFSVEALAGPRENGSASSVVEFLVGHGIRPRVCL